jgi:hypothetical protein
MPYRGQSCRRGIIGRDQQAIGSVADQCIERESCWRRIIGREQQAIGSVAVQCIESKEL